MTTIGELGYRAMRAPIGRRLPEEWVSVTVRKLTGLGQPDYTYLGCAKQVFGPPGNHPWPCRKRIAIDDTLDDEVLNHSFKHVGPCNLPANDMPCFAFEVLLEDESGQTYAQMWASATYMLGMFSFAFYRLGEAGMAMVLGNVLNKTFHLQLMTRRRDKREIMWKILFVKPAVSPGREPTVGQGMDDPSIYDLAISMGHLQVYGVVQGAGEEEVQAPPEEEVSSVLQVSADDQLSNNVVPELLITVRKDDLEHIVSGLDTNLQALRVAQDTVAIQILNIHNSLKDIKQRLGLALD